MENIEELKLNIYNSFDKYRIDENTFNKCTIDKSTSLGNINVSIDKTKTSDNFIIKIITDYKKALLYLEDPEALKKASDAMEAHQAWNFQIDPEFNFEIFDDDWIGNLNTDARKSILEWHNKISHDYFEDADYDWGIYINLFVTHPVMLLNLCILYENYEDFLTLTDETIKASSSDLPITLKSHLDYDFGFIQQQFHAYMQIADHILYLDHKKDLFFEKIKLIYDAPFNIKNVKKKLRSILESLLIIMLDHWQEVSYHETSSTAIILKYYNYLKSVKHDTSNILKKFIKQNDNSYKPRGLDLVRSTVDADSYVFGDNFGILTELEIKENDTFLNTYDRSTQINYIDYITNSIELGCFDLYENDIHVFLVEKISEEDNNEINLKIQFYLTLTRFYIVEGQCDLAETDFYKHVVPLYRRLTDSKLKDLAVIKILELNLNTFIDLLKGNYSLNENSTDYFYNVLDVLGELRNHEGFSTYSSKVFKTLHLNYELLVKYDFTFRQKKKIIQLSNHDYQFSSNLFALYYLNKYKENIIFLEFITRNSTKDVNSYLGIMSMNIDEWSNYFIDEPEETYKDFSLKNNIPYHDFYNENYDIDLDFLINSQNSENQYNSPIIIYDDDINDYKLEYKEDYIDFGIGIINERILNIEYLEPININHDVSSNEYAYLKIEKLLESKKDVFHILFLIKFYTIIIKHYSKENKTDSLKKATKDLLKLSNSFELSQTNIYDICLLFMDLNKFNTILDLLKKMTDSDLKNKVIDLFCSKHSTKDILRQVYSLDKITSRKIVERLIVSNRVFSEDEYFMLCNISAGYTVELNYLLTSQNHKVT